MIPNDPTRWAISSRAKVSAAQRSGRVVSTSDEHEADWASLVCQLIRARRRSDIDRLTDAELRDLVDVLR